MKTTKLAYNPLYLECAIYIQTNNELKQDDATKTTNIGYIAEFLEQFTIQEQVNMKLRIAQEYTLLNSTIIASKYVKCDDSENFVKFDISNISLHFLSFLALLSRHFYPGTLKPQERSEVLKMIPSYAKRTAASEKAKFAKLLDNDLPHLKDEILGLCK